MHLYDTNVWNSFICQKLQVYLSKIENYSNIHQLVNGQPDYGIALQCHIFLHKNEF